ncbi:MAG: hypothetical protein ACP5HQ_03450 [Thermoprotei archaeon]
MKFKLAKVKVLNEGADPIYFATPAGLYRAKGHLYAKTTILVVLLTVVLPFVIFILAAVSFPRIWLGVSHIFGSLLYPPPGTPGWALALNHLMFYALMAVTLFATFVLAPVLGPILFLKSVLKRLSVKGELVTDWANVSRVEIVNERVYEKLNNTTGFLISATYGDLRFFTRDGREIVVRNVKDPRETLEYLRSAYGLNLTQ